MGYICVHGHFYQPPRENPWLEAVELQDSAYPYHDWNERITAECYAPNSASRVLDDQNRIREIVNNYSSISFNFGPTLLSWLESGSPRVYRAILEADTESQTRYSGHGSALSQCYNHLIMPLANGRDKRTQVIWGIRDFEYRFGRKPEGMWLPETAVDLATLEILAENGIRFTILAPRQARRMRKIGGRNWREVSDERVDPTMAYLLRLPSRRSINLFFYDGPISRGIAFEGVLDNGEAFASRLLGAFSDERAWPELVHVATDGETYGHHHRYGEMALTYALEHIRSNHLADITNYSEYLERHPPTHEIEIFENSSWSCVHGIERWRSNCGCNAGHAGWTQAWREPLREALDWLRDALAPRFEEKAKEYFKDPWLARDDYIAVVLDRRRETAADFLSRHSKRQLNESEAPAALKLMELQRHLMLMYTSCGWFFDEISGIETVQVIRYACRALQLSHQVLGDNIEAAFLEKLSRAKSNIPEHQDGARIYQLFALPAAIDLEKVAAHYAISSLFKPYGNQAEIYCYSVDRTDQHSVEAGKMKLGLGRARFTSKITLETDELVFAALHFGDHNLRCGIGTFRDGAAYQKLVMDITAAFSSADVPEVLRLMDTGLDAPYSLKSLFSDDRRTVLRQIVNSSVEEAEAGYRRIYENNIPLAHFLQDSGVPLPRAIRTAAEFAVNSQLRLVFANEQMDTEQARKLIEEARSGGIEFDATTLEYTLRLTIERLFESFEKEPFDLAAVEQLEAVVELAQSLPFKVVLWTAQNTWAKLHRSAIEELKSDARAETIDVASWTQHFLALGEKLQIQVGNGVHATAG